MLSVTGSPQIISICSATIQSYNSAGGKMIYDQSSKFELSQHPHRHVISIWTFKAISLWLRPHGKLMLCDHHLCPSLLASHKQNQWGSSQGRLQVTPVSRSYHFFSKETYNGVQIPGFSYSIALPHPGLPRPVWSCQPVFHWVFLQQTPLSIAPLHFLLGIPVISCLMMHMLLGLGRLPRLLLLSDVSCDITLYGSIT